MPKGQVCPEFRFQQSGQVSIAVTRKSLTGWSRKMDYRKAERVTSQNGIQKAVNFSLV
jgi:hypothetical protein